MQRTPHVERRWALQALWAVLTVATMVSAYMAWAHLQLTHGPGTFESLCNVGDTFNCDLVNTSAWSSLAGAPISIWALPLYGAMAWLAHIGQRATPRGARARGTLVVLTGFTVAFSAFMGWVAYTDVGYLCLFCITLYTLHIASLVLVLLPPDGRMPALPVREDWLPAGGLLVGLTVLSVPGSWAWASRLDQQVIDAMAADDAVAVAEDVPAVTGVPEAPAVMELQRETRPGGKFQLPKSTKEVHVADHNPSLGPADAAVVVVEYADFECGYCRKLSHELASIKEKYSDRVRFVFRHYPMDQDCNDLVSRTHHKRACEASVAAQCAHEQGEFWAYHDLLFRNQRHLEDDDLLHYADTAGLDLDAFSTCLTDPAPRAAIAADIASAGELEISGTPRTYVEGREFRGATSRAILDAAIKVALGQAELDEEGKVEVEREIIVSERPPAGPIDMVHLTTGGMDFWMDAVEAGVDPQGIAQAVVGASPTAVTWFEAKTACEGAGKRMCTAEEWLASCQGVRPEDTDGDGKLYGDYVQGRLFPYGDHYQVGVCLDSANEETGKPTPVGLRGGCRTPEGVFDLTGNLQEWAGATPDEAVLLGGAWYREDKSSCVAYYDIFGAGYANRSTGFRCCADTPPVVAAAPEAPAQTGARIAEGEPLPPFSASTPDGEALDQTFIAGKVAVINFWASWCGPCQRELPDLNVLQRTYGEKGLQVLAINVDRETSKATALFRRMNLDYPTLLDTESRIMGHFDVMAMPTSLLVDRDGKVVMQHTGYSKEWLAELEAKIVSLL